MDVVDLSAVEQRRLLAGGTISARELLDAHLARVALHNPALAAVVAVDVDVAQRHAAEADRRLAAGDRAPLLGLVTAHKDLDDTAEFVTTYGSPVFAGFRPSADSLVVSRMRAAGVVAIGKTNTPEFGLGSHTFNPVYGTTRNPYDPARSAGGSSGGAAVALRTGMIGVADGSDMGGSLRNPAAWNNVVGLRPTPGAVPEVGPGPAWRTLGVHGPLGRCVDDVALLLTVIAGPDPRDPLSRPFDLAASPDPVGPGLRVAWSPSLGGLPVEGDVAGVLAGVPALCAALGWRVEEAEPDLDGADACFEVVRSWTIANGTGRLLGPRLAAVKATYQDEVERGRRLTGADVAAALDHLTVLLRRAVAFFETVDVLMGPVTQLSPFPVEWEYPVSVAGTPMERYLTWMRSCSRVSVLGCPAMSVPFGFTATGLPVGVQLVGAPWSEARLLAAAATIEQAAGAAAQGPSPAVAPA